MGSLLDFRFKFPDWAAQFQANMPRLKRKAMATVQTNRGMLFKNEGAYNGHSRWKELKSGKSQNIDAKSGEKERKILQKTGTLKNSLAPQGASKEYPQAGPDGILEFHGDTLKIGTNVKYAAIHNYGGVVRHPGSKNGFGMGIEIPPHNIRIPARPFLEGAWNQEDQKELDDTIANFCARLLSGGR